jgi:hypothetical protein
MSNKFYEFNQINSGGWYQSNENVDELVIIEANSSDEANQIAENIGIYFNGVEKDIDCGCCGDRWYPCYSGDEVIIDGNIIENYVKEKLYKRNTIIHFKNGEKINLNFD